MQLTGFRKVKRPLTVNDFHILALLLQFFIIFHSVFWCCQADLLWNGCGKAKGRFSVRMWPGDPAPQSLALGCLVSLSPGTSKCLSGSPLQCKSGSLTSNILLPLSTCQHVTRNEAVSTCSSSRWWLSPCISAHDFPCLLLLLLFHFLPHFSPLVTVPFLLPWTCTNPRGYTVGTLEEGLWVYGNHLQSAII